MTDTIIYIYGSLIHIFLKHVKIISSVIKYKCCHDFMIFDLATMNVVIIVETIQYIEFTYRTNKEVLHDAHFLMVRVLHIAYVKFLDIILLKVDNVF